MPIVANERKVEEFSHNNVTYKNFELGAVNFGGKIGYINSSSTSPSYQLLNAFDIDYCNALICDTSISTTSDLLNIINTLYLDIKKLKSNNTDSSTGGNVETIEIINDIVEATCNITDAKSYYLCAYAGLTPFNYIYIDDELIADYVNNTINKLSTATLESDETSIDGAIPYLYDFTEGEHTIKFILNCNTKTFNAFLFCEIYTSVIIPNQIHFIGTDAFNGCINLTNVTLPNTIECIDANAFLNCTSLLNIIIPENTEFIGLLSFKSCRNLLYISFPDKLNILYYQSFYNCNNLTSIDLSNTKISFIGDYTFCDCNNLTSLSFPKTLTKIEGNATFLGCDKLETLVLPELTSSINTDFYELPLLHDLYSLSPNVPDTSANSFYSDATLYIGNKSSNTKYVYVPLDSYNNYKNNSIWNDELTNSKFSIIGKSDLSIDNNVLVNTYNTKITYNIECYDIIFYNEADKEYYDKLIYSINNYSANTYDIEITANDNVYMLYTITLLDKTEKSNFLDNFRFKTNYIKTELYNNYTSYFNTKNITSVDNIKFAGKVIFKGRLNRIINNVKSPIYYSDAFILY